MDDKQLEAARRAKRLFASAVPPELEVVGIGIGLSGSVPALKVNLRSKPADESCLPRTIEGVPVIYSVVGKLKAL